MKRAYNSERSILMFCCRLAVLACLYMVIGSGYANAQSRIDNFYGLRLGMTKSQVVSVLNSKSKKYEQKSNRNDEIYFQLKNVKLGDCTFNISNLIFDDGILVRGVFFSDDSRILDPNFDGHFISQIENSAKTYKSVFNRMYVNFASKYGEPQISDENEYIWINGNKLTLDYVFSDETIDQYSHLITAMVRVRYELMNSRSSDY